MKRSNEIKRRAGIKRNLNFGEAARKIFFRLQNFFRFRRRRSRMKENFFRVCVAAAIFFIFFAAFGFLRPGIRVKVDAETVAAFRVPHSAIGTLRVVAAQNEISFAELFAIFNAENNFFPQKHAAFEINSINASEFNRLQRRYNSKSLAPYVTMFENLFAEIENFPVAENDSTIMFGDSWGVGTNFQGTKTHMGTAIVDRENIRGRVSVVSMTRGAVREAGFDANLGYFVSVATENNTRYVYAHLESIATGISVGTKISAGQHLGQMGNSGGGKNKSFPVHLHVAIAPEVSFTRGDFRINPYPLLRYIENAEVG
ncbi:MAG: M23 family metallopeptidase [Defluviitaleaceae bacterium]|nr:M23 family metallopeptidase [Defluviitaleaceae bacterium]